MNTTTTNHPHRGLRARGGRLLAVSALALGSLGVAACADDDDDDPFMNGTNDGTEDTWDGTGNDMDGTGDDFGEDDPGEPAP